jgi:hypothetical protein
MQLQHEQPLLPCWQLWRKGRCGVGILDMLQQFFTLSAASVPSGVLTFREFYLVQAATVKCCDWKSR